VDKNKKSILMNPRQILPKGIYRVIVLIIVWEAIRVIGLAQVFYWREVEKKHFSCSAEFIQGMPPMLMCVTVIIS
jgi:hypothetical protein